MDRIRRLLQEPSFHVLLVFLFLLIFGWPFMTVTESGSPKASFMGLFAAWGAFIVVLFFISRK